MKKYLLALFFVPVLFLISQAVLAQSAIISNVSPDADTFWFAGETKSVTWSNTVPFTVCRSELLSLGLFTLDANGLPNYRTDASGQYIYDYPGVIISPTSGTISLPSTAIPRQYKVVVRCQNLGLITGSSAGIVTLSNPNFQPLTISQPATPVSYAVGAYVGIVVNANNALAVGTPVIVKLVKKSDQTPVWTATGDAACILTNVNSCGTAIQTSETSQFTAGVVYLLKAEVQFNGQTYVTSSGDITFTASTPPPPTASTITNLQTDRANYAVGDTITIIWNTNITDKNDLTLKRYESDGTLIAQATPNNLLNHTVVVGSTFTVGKSYYYTLTGGSPAVTAQSGNFTVTTGDTLPPPPPHRSWTPPLYSPHDCDGSQGFDPGCYPPINVSAEMQEKAGALRVTGFRSYLDALFDTKVRARLYCDYDGNNCYPIAALVGGTGPGGTPDNYSCPDGQSIGTINNGSVTRCEPDDTGGGGPTDPNVWQKRVSSTCAEGSSIRVIDVNGGVICEEDTANTSTTGGTVTSVGSGNGLTGGPITTTGTLSLRLDCGKDEILKWIHNVGGTPGNNRWMCATDNTGGTGGGSPGSGLVCDASNKKLLWNGSVWSCGTDLDTTYTADNSTLQLSNNQFSIKDSGVTTDKIAADAVTLSKIADNSVNNSRLALTVYSYYTNNQTSFKSLGAHEACFLQGTNDGGIFNSGQCSVYPSIKTPTDNIGLDYSVANVQEWRMIARGGASCRALCF